MKGHTELITQYCQCLDSIIDQLRDRRTQITVPIEFTQSIDHSEEIEKLFSDYNKIVSSNNDYSSQLNSAKATAQKALRLQEIADFCVTIGYSDSIKKLSELKDNYDKASKAVDDTVAALENKRHELAGKRRQLNDEEEGARSVNKYLNDYFGHNFVSLEAEEVTEGEKRIKFRIMRGGKPAFNLSEGECSLISFCYFMAKLNDVETSGIKPIIWIDDPISSLDSNHVFFVYSLLRAEIVEKDRYEQLFVSTHNLDFLKYLKRITGKDNDKNIRFFVVQRKDRSSSITPMPLYLQKYVTEFNYLFNEIYQCSKIEIVDDTNYMSFYNFGNNARKFLEILMFYHYPDDTKQLDKLEKFFGVGRVPAILTDRINNEYSHLCGIFERGEVPTEVPEMLKTSKFIIETIKQKNPEQYASLVASIS